MHPLYLDIIEKAGPPDWYSDGGVPRYGKFDPNTLDIYSAYSCLYLLQCQSCGLKFKVGTSAVELNYNFATREFDKPVMPSKENGLGSFYFGDAPWHEEHGGQCAGTTMTSDEVAVLEFWIHNHKSWEWVRHPEYEIVFEY